MKDVTPASLARAAFLRAADCSESTFEGQEILLDLFTLLVMVKGRDCDIEDIKRAQLVAGLRFGPNPPACFDLLEYSISEDVHDHCAQDDWISVMNAAHMLEEAGDGNVSPIGKGKNGGAA